MNERKKSGIYIIRNVVNGNCYIGQAKSIGDRWYTHKSHLNCGYHHSRHLQSAWKKYGPDSFVFEVLEYVELNKDLLFEREQYWFDTLSPQYNIAPAAVSSIGVKHPPRTEEFKERMRVKQLGFRHSEETKAMLKAMAAELNYKHPPEVRARISKGLKGRIKKPETIEKHRAKMIGRKQSKEHIAKRVAHLIGHTVSDYCKQRTAEANRARLLGTKQSPDLIEKRIAPLRGKKRPPEVIAAMHAALAETRKPTLDKIRAALISNPDLNQTHLAAELKCARSTIRKVKRELQCQLHQQSDNANAAPNLPKRKALLSTSPYRQPQQLSLPLG